MEPDSLGCSESVVDGGFPHFPQCSYPAVSHCGILFTLCCHPHLVCHHRDRSAVEPAVSGGASGVECVVPHRRAVSAGWVQLPADGAAALRRSFPCLCSSGNRSEACRAVGYSYTGRQTGKSARR